MTRGVLIPPFERSVLLLKNINGVSNVRFLFYTLLKELLYYNERGYRIKKSDSPKSVILSKAKDLIVQFVYLYYTYHV